jgi:hypothetical protein
MNGIGHIRKGALKMQESTATYPHGRISAFGIFRKDWRNSYETYHMYLSIVSFGCAVPNPDVGN